MTNLELYFEEQRILLQKLQKSIVSLNKKVQKQIDSYVPPSKDVNVTGSVSVNTEKEIEISNLNNIKDWLADTSEVIKNAIKASKVEPLKSIRVDNIEDAKAKSLKIDNLNTLEPYFKSIEEVLIRIQPIVNVEKQELPTRADKPIPVRLSDGKNFYKAIFNAITGSDMPSDPLVGYQIADRDESGTSKYYGYVRKDGYWYIMKETNGAYRYAIGAPRETGGGLYTDAWTDKANLNYSYFYEVF